MDAISPDENAPDIDAHDSTQHLPTSDLLTALPREVLQYSIFPFLSLGPLITGLGSTCTTLRALATSDVVLRPHLDCLFHLDTVPELGYFRAYIDRMNEMKSLARRYWKQEQMKSARCSYGIIAFPVFSLCVVFVLGCVGSSILAGFGSSLGWLTTRIVGLVFAGVLFLLLAISSLQCCVGMEIWHCLMRRVRLGLHAAVSEEQLLQFRRLEYDGEWVEPERDHQEAMLMEEEERIMMEEEEKLDGFRLHNIVRRYVYPVALEEEDLLAGMSLARRERWQYKLLATRLRLSHAEEFGIDAYAHVGKWQIQFAVLMLCPMAVSTAVLYAVLRTFLPSGVVGFGAGFFSVAFLLHFVLVLALLLKSYLALYLGRRSLPEEERKEYKRASCVTVAGTVLGAFITEIVCVLGLIAIFVPVSLAAEGAIGRSYVPLMFLPLWIGFCAGCVAFVFLGFSNADDIGMFLFKHTWMLSVSPCLMIGGCCVCWCCWIVFFVLFILFFVGIVSASPFYACIPVFVVLGIMAVGLCAYAVVLWYQYYSEYRAPEMELVEIAQRLLKPTEETERDMDYDVVTRTAPRPVKEERMTVM